MLSQPTKSGESTNRSKRPIEDVDGVESPSSTQGNKVVRRKVKGKSKANESTCRELERADGKKKNTLDKILKQEIEKTKQAMAEVKRYETDMNIILQDTSKLMPYQQEAHRKLIEKIMLKYQ